MCSYLILCYDEKNMNILLPKLEQNVANAKSDLKKTFYFSIKSKHFLKYLLQMSREKHLDIHEIF